MSLRITFIIQILIAFVWFSGLAFAYWYSGHPTIASLFAIPSVAYFLILFFPKLGFSYFAFIAEMGPTKKDNESSGSFELRKAGLWGLGGLLAPISFLVYGIAPSIWLSNENFGGVVFIGFLLGIACIFKSIGRLIQIVKLRKTFDSNP